jgi:hypothetical protein
MPRWLFWTALYLACVASGLIVTPGLPEAVGFAMPAFIAAALVAWFARRQPSRSRHILATTTAAGLMLGAITGVLGDNHRLDHGRSYEVAGSPMA